MVLLMAIAPADVPATKKSASSLYLSKTICKNCVPPKVLVSLSWLPPLNMMASHFFNRSMYSSFIASARFLMCISPICLQPIFPKALR